MLKVANYPSDIFYSFAENISGEYIIYSAVLIVLNGEALTEELFLTWDELRARKYELFNNYVLIDDRKYRIKKGFKIFYNVENKDNIVIKSKINKLKNIYKKILGFEKDLHDNYANRSFYKNYEILMKQGTLIVFYILESNIILYPKNCSNKYIYEVSLKNRELILRSGNAILDFIYYWKNSISKDNISIFIKESKHMFAMHKKRADMENKIFNFLYEKL